MKRYSKTYLALTLATALLLTLGVSFRALIADDAHIPLGFGAADAHAETTQYTCGMHPFVIQDEPGNCPICGMDLTPLKPKTAAVSAGERKIKYWVAPMDPTYIRDEPGKSPMGMDLVPVYEDEAPAGAVITIDPVTVQNMGVRTATVERRTLQRNIRTSGIVQYEEPKQYSVNSKISGWIERLYVNETGQFVKKGAPLLEIYSPELVAAQEEYLLALENRNDLAGSTFAEITGGAQRLLDAARKRLRLWDISERQIRRLEQTGQVQKTLTLYAPYNGILTHKNAVEGLFAKAGMQLFQLADISRVWIFADIYEYELPWIKVGQEALIRLPYAGTEEIHASIDYINPFVETKTRTVKARMTIANPGFELKPDMFVSVRVAAQKSEEVLAVPAEAVLASGEKQTVFVALGEGKFEPRQVQVGLRGDEGYIEIRQGLLDGEQVVTSAQFMLDSESQLRAAIQKMLHPEPLQPAAEETSEEMEELF